MSCFDWRPLLAHRFDSELEAPPQWRQARLHLESCEACRLEASLLDPTLVFKNAAAWSPEGAEFEAIRAAVRTLRRTGELSARATTVDAEARVRSRRIVSAALLAVALAMLPSSTANKGAEHVESSRFAPSSQILRTAGPAAPAIEGIDRPAARVYEWGADDLSVVMVVDESLDV